MKNFSDKLKVDNKEYFPLIYKIIVKQKLRSAITKHIVSHEENDYFSLDEFKDKLDIKDIKNVKDCADELVSELKEIGWNTTFSYGGTAMFIYSTEKPPSNCYPDNMI